MSKVTIVCAQCGTPALKKKGEIRRRLEDEGATRFFCSRGCALTCARAKRMRHPLKKNCKFCGLEFDSMTGARAYSFCSRSCASRGSVTEFRREKAKATFAINAIRGPSTAGMLKREAWKYVKLIQCLDMRGLKYEFEFMLPGSGMVFDLSIPDQRLIVEFDGPYHQRDSQREIDGKRDALASQLGWCVRRVATPPACVIEPYQLERILDELS